MGYQNTINVLLNEIDDLKELLLHMQERKEISTIEVDLAKDKLRQVYEIFRMVENSNHELPPTDEPVAPSSPVKNQEHHEEEMKETKEAEAEAKKKELEQRETDIPDRERPAHTEEFEVKAPTQKPPMTEEEMSLTLGDKYKSSAGSLNDHMGKGKKMSDLASKYQAKPIKNIHTAIGLNEKFQLIKELFKGDADLYNQTIDELNNASNFNQAYMYLNDNFDWDMDNDLVKRILELTRRKFISQGDE